MWIEYNPSPISARVGDCAVRAIAKALDTDWESAYALLAISGYAMADMPSSKVVVASVLRQHGFYREAIPNGCPDCYTAEDFCRDHPRGIYVLAFDNHIATVESGDLYDMWDSSNEVPLFYWYQKGEK